jgi:hypothetical protein
MSAFYDQASLVVVPSGYKSGKIYAQKPLTTDGQLTFTRASTATRVNASGLIESVASGVPRLDYLGSTCPKLLLEPQRSNIALRSEEFDNAIWGKSLVTITSNYDTAPNGLLTADRFVSAGGAFPQIGQSNTVVPGTQYTASIYVKSDGTAQIAQVIILGGVSVSFTPTTSWQRVSVTFTASLSSASFVIATNSPVAPASSFVIWGAQLEAGAYATSYVKTEAAAVTRLADNANKTSISGLIGQTEGTVYWEGTLNSFGAFPQIFDLHTLPGNFIQVYNSVVSGTPRIGIYIQNTTLLFNSANITAISYDTKLKLAFAYKANNYTLYLNGTQVWTNTSIASVPATASFSLGDSGAGASTSVKSVNQALIFKTRLTNAQLAELTTL